MKVVAAINGSLVAEGSAFLALYYAKELGFDLLLLHVKNPKDALSDVKKSAAEIEKVAQNEGVACETIFLKGHQRDAIPACLEPLHVDTFFCSTRMHKRFITDSFSEHLLKMKLNTNIAVVRIVHMHNFKEVNALLLPIKESKLSVEKFTFVSTLATAYKSDVEIFSISLTTKNKLAKFDMAALREQFSRINFALRHYMDLSRLMPFTLKVKHEFASSETESILKHMASSEAQLVIVGAKRLSFFSFLRSEKPIERLVRETSRNLIAYYPKED
jgi:nucleotide-binding universal stress UspA family protein